MTFLLRRKSTFDQDARMQEFIKSGRAKLSFGDATSIDDVKRAWDVAVENGKVDYIISSVGKCPCVDLGIASVPVHS